MPAARLQEAEAHAMDASDDGNGICPISLECGLVVPRKSIDVSKLPATDWEDKHSPLDLCVGSKQPRAAKSPSFSTGGRHMSVAALPARHTASKTAPAGPMSSETPSELLTADGRLNMATMMEYSGHSQSSHQGVPRMNSFSSRFSRSVSGKVGFHVGDTRKAMTSPRSSLSHDTAAGQGGNAASNRLQEPQLSRQLLQLAAACRVRDVRLLQQLLAAGTPVSAALDSYANTALHLLLLPVRSASAAAADASARSHGHSTHSPQQPQQQQYACTHNVSSGSSINGSSSSGAFSWLTACFTGGSSSISMPHSQSSSVLSCKHTLSPAAAASAQVSMATALLAAGASVNYRNADGLTPLMLAARQVATASGSSSINSTLKVLELLLTKDRMADVNMKDSAGRTALVHLLIHHQHVDYSMTTAAAAARGGSVHSEPVVGRSASSISNADWADVNVSPSVMTSVTTAAAAATAPSASAAAAQIKAVQLLLHHGADINAADAAGMTPLMHAAAQPGASKELLQKMLELGANSRLLDNKRRSALTHAMIAQQLKLIPATGAGFEKHRSSHSHHSINGLNSSGSQSASAAAAAAASSQAGCAPVPGYYHAAAAAGAAANVAASCGNGNGFATAGISSSVDGSDVAPQVASANMSFAVSFHLSSSSSSHSSGHRSMVHDRLTKAQQLHSNGFWSPFPLPNHASVIRALCSYGALDLHPSSINTRFPGIDNYSQLHIAMRRGDVRAMQLLLASGAEVNVQDSYGNSPLMYWTIAPEDPEELVVELAGELLSHGADPNIPNNDGWTALDLACELSKLGKVLVKPAAVPVHALLVGYGAKNSEAFLQQHRHQPSIMCMRTDSANSVLRSGKSCDSLRVAVPSSCSEPVMLPPSVLEELSGHCEQ